ncbi:MAG TPA: NADH-quinone oxidoreductase subunit J [Terriglobales bacterium]|nr:NADH-quinone oxidoreductase subunit J [Terriglobales bacterium]
MEALFYIAGAVAIFATVMTVTRLNAIHALLYFIVSLLSVSVIFYILGAPFIAALEVIIYAGAIMVLFIFVVMMLNLGQRAVDMESKWLSPGMWIGPEILAAILIAEVVYLLRVPPVEVHAIQAVEPREVGLALFGRYLIGVELASMLLLGALVGAYHLGYRKPKALENPDADHTYATRAAAGGDLVRAGHDRSAGAP